MPPKLCSTLLFMLMRVGENRTLGLPETDERNNKIAAVYRSLFNVFKSVNHACCESPTLVKFANQSDPCGAFEGVNVMRRLLREIVCKTLLGDATRSTPVGEGIRDVHAAPNILPMSCPDIVLSDLRFNAIVGFRECTTVQRL